MPFTTGQPEVESQKFEIVSDFQLTGDQPQAGMELVSGLEAGERALT